MQYRYGMFMNFWENTWKADFVKYIKKCQALGFDVLEFQAQSLLEMRDDEICALRRVADEHGILLCSCDDVVLKNNQIVNSMCTRNMPSRSATVQT